MTTARQDTVVVSPRSLLDSRARMCAQELDRALAALEDALDDLEDAQDEEGEGYGTKRRAPKDP